MLVQLHIKGNNYHSITGYHMILQLRNKDNLIFKSIIAIRRDIPMHIHNMM